MILLLKQYTTEKVFQLIEKKYPNYEIIRFFGSQFDVSELLHTIQSENLFGTNQVVFLSDIDRDSWPAIIAGLHQKTKDSIVVWSEDSFPKEFLKKMPDHELLEGKKETATTSEIINPFSIANVLPTGDGKTIWPTYRTLVEKGNAPEAIFGIMWWKLKDLAKKKKEISPAFKKTLRHFLNTYSQARETGGELETGLEKTILQITKKDLA